MKSLALAVILAAGLVAAPARAFGALPLSVPAGWTPQQQEGLLLLVPGDLAAGQVYTVIIPDVTMKVGSVRGLLDVGKASLNEAGKFRPTGEPARGQNAAGWEYDVVIGPLEKGDKVLIAQAMGLRKGEEEGIILVIADGVETLTRYSDAFTAMIKTMGSGSARPAPAAPAGSGADLRFRVPDGWTAKPVDGGVLLEKSLDSFYEKYTFRVLILPSQPLQDPLRKTYLESWATLVTPSLDTKIVPLPFMRRLRSGAVIAYDTDTAAKTKNGVSVNGGLVLVAQGTRYVPIYVVFLGDTMSGKLEDGLTTLLESAQIPGAGSARVPMFAPADLVGEWSSSSASYASYVTSSGSYAGDASIAIAETLVLGSDQSFRRSFQGVKSSLVIREKDEGTWRLEDMVLVQNGKEKVSTWVLAVGADPKAGAFLVLGTYKNQEQKPSFSNPRGAFQGTWFKRKE